MPTAITLELPDDVSATAEEAAKRERDARMRVLAEQAMADTDFVADLQETMRASRHSDNENRPGY